MYIDLENKLRLILPQTVEEFDKVNDLIKILTEKLNNYKSFNFAGDCYPIYISKYDHPMIGTDDGGDLCLYLSESARITTTQIQYRDGGVWKRLSDHCISSMTDGNVKLVNLLEVANEYLKI